MPKSTNSRDSFLLSSTARRAGLAIWMVCLTVLSLLPMHVKRSIGTTGFLHNAGHLTAFAITGIFLLPPRRPGFFDAWRIWPGVLFAISLEWLEAAVYGNAFEWRDVATEDRKSVV